MVNWNFDPSQYKEKNFELVPVGDHRLRIEDVVERSVSGGNPFKSGNEGFEIVFSVNGYSSRVWYYIVLDPSNPERTNQNLGSFFKSFGITSFQLGNGKQWEGLVGAARLKHDTYNDNTKAVVSYFIEKEKQDTLAPWTGGQDAYLSAGVPEISKEDLPF